MQQKEITNMTEEDYDLDLDEEEIDALTLNDTTTNYEVWLVGLNNCKETTETQLVGKFTDAKEAVTFASGFDLETHGIIPKSNTAEFVVEVDEIANDGENEVNSGTIFRIEILI